MQPLKTNGILGTKLVDDFDKQALFQEEEVFHPVSHYIPDDEEEYFEKAVKDGIYLDYIKKLIYSFNIQKIEQRAAREGKKDMEKILFSLFPALLLYSIRNLLPFPCISFVR